MTSEALDELLSDEVQEVQTRQPVLYLFVPGAESSRSAKSLKLNQHIACIKT